MKERFKNLFRNMMTPIDGKKTNWWINGIAIFLLLLMIIEVLSNG